MLMKVLSANAATSTSAEKISGQTNKQTNKLEGYSRHSRQPSLNDSHLLLVSANIIYIESKNSGSKTE